MLGKLDAGATHLDSYFFDMATSHLIRYYDLPYRVARYADPGPLDFDVFREVFGVFPIGHGFGEYSGGIWASLEIFGFWKNFEVFEMVFSETGPSESGPSEAGP